ncbi:VOC family protein [Nonomuraea sp. NPDC046802]|uniref:VOC family protein n=1 Tax=Nonomuraea sp. NPDC046802 TaxID=3154919 RepID=UPI0033D6BBBA
MGHDIGGLHHVGHLVHDMGQALERYRRLGFALPGPAYPVLGEPPEPFGVGNTHAYLADGFIELVSVAGASGRMPDDVRLIPLHAPAERLPALKTAVSRAAGNLEDRLRRFEGVHILMFDSANIDAAAARLTESGVGHGGVLDTQRPVETADELRMEPARLLEIDGVGAGRVPEGRVGVASNATAFSVEHPNGAVGLVECVLCVADAELDDVERRYALYLGRTAGRDARKGLVRTFPLDGDAKVTLAAASGLDGMLPGEVPKGLPGFVAYAVGVRDVAATERLLRESRIPLGRTSSGEVFVPAREAFGVAIIFRQTTG